MPCIVVTPPQPLVSLEDAKKHLRVDADDDSQDSVITRCIAAAAAQIDGPDGRLGRAIGAQEIEEQRLAFPHSLFGVWDADMPHRCLDGELFIVRCPPIIDLVEVSYLDDLGQRQQIDVATLPKTATEIAPPDGGWPSGRRQLGSVKVRYRAGYEDVPAAITAAILLMMAALYENRETAQVVSLSTVDALLGPYRVHL